MEPDPEDPEEPEEPEEPEAPELVLVQMPQVSLHTSFTSVLYEGEEQIMALLSAQSVG